MSKSCLSSYVRIGVVLSASSLALAQESKPKAAENKKPSDNAEWMAETAPDEHHKRLDMLVGTWSQTIRTPSQDGKGIESKGTAKYRWILGGRFLVEEVRCDFQGTSFEWMGIYGYDKVKKKYTAMWVDNFGTQMDVAEAEPDPAGKSFSFVGDQIDPQTGKKAKFRWVITLEGKDKSKVEMFETGPEGKEEKSWEIIQIRRAAADNE